MCILFALQFSLSSAVFSSRKIRSHRYSSSIHRYLLPTRQCLQVVSEIELSSRVGMDQVSDVKRQVEVIEFAQSIW